MSVMMPVRAVRLMGLVLRPSWILAVSAFLLVSWVDAASAASSQQADDAVLRTYDRAFFNRFRPQSAFDIVARIPGFSLDGGANVRGFGGAAGNLLIDGSRPAAKSGGISRILSQIPADAIERVEILSGASLQGETAGQALLANLILGGEERSATAEIGLQYDIGLRPAPSFGLALAGPAIGWDTTTNIEGGIRRFPGDGRRITRAANGELARYETDPSLGVDYQLSGSTTLQRSALGGDLSINAEAGYYRFETEGRRDVFEGRLPDLAPDSFRGFTGEFKNWSGEVSAELRRPLPRRWQLTLLGLVNAVSRDNRTTSETLAADETFETGQVFTVDRLGREAVLRAAVAKNGNRWSPEAGVELAYNTLDSDIGLEKLDQDGTRRPVNLSISDTLVSELRGEAFLNLSRSLSSRWTLETGSALEVSTIRVEGDAENERSLSFIKPFASLIYQFGSDGQARLSVRRKISQLAFGAFTASAQLDDDRTFGGNAQIEPSALTRYTLTLDLRSERLGALNIEPFLETREDVLEQTKLASGTVGRANAGDATVWGAEVEASLDLEPLIPGGLVELDVTAQKASFDDPITGETRSVNGFTEVFGNIDFRQDLPDEDFAWGASYFNASERRTFFVSELLVSTCRDTASVFFETTRFLGVKARLRISDIGGRNICTERTFFEPDRGGTITGSQSVDRERQQTFLLRVEKTF